jgi:hypothetical protein
LEDEVHEADDWGLGGGAGEFGVCAGLDVEAFDFVDEVFEAGLLVAVGGGDEGEDVFGVGDGEFDVALEEEGEVVYDAEVEGVLGEEDEFVGFGAVGDDAVFVGLFGLEEAGEVGVGAGGRVGDVFDVEVGGESFEDGGTFEEAGVGDGVGEGLSGLDMGFPKLFDLGDVEEVCGKDDVLYVFVVVFEHDGEKGVWWVEIVKSEMGGGGRRWREGR